MLARLHKYQLFDTSPHMQSSEKKRILEYLGRKLAEGNLVLFTGAGFSMAAKDLAGQNLPSGPGLAGEIWKLAFPDQDFDPSSALPDVYQAARSAGERKLVDFLRDRLAVDPNTLPDWYAQYVNQPWRKIYTLNIDSLFHAAGIKFNARRPVQIISGMETSEALAHLHNELIVRHINGSLEDLPDGVTFTDAQYGSRLAGQDPLYALLCAELLRFPFVFIGTELDESVLWQHISLRKLKGRIRGFKETRPQSLLIVPKLSVARQKALSEYNIAWLPITAEEFAKDFLSNLRDSSVAGFSHLLAEGMVKKIGRTKIPLVSELIATDAPQPSSSEYLLGSEPSWKDVVSGRAIVRDRSADWLHEIVTAQKSKAAKAPVCLITGTAGDGKTTIAMQIAAKLAADGMRIGWIDDASNIPPHDIPRLAEATGQLESLFIDDADMYGSSLQHVISDVCSRKLAKTLVLGIRAAKVDRLLDTVSLDGYKRNEFATYRLSDDEINRLLELLQQENLLGALKTKSRSEQAAIIREKDQADRQLLVAMIEATSGVEFGKRVCDEYEELDTLSRDLYCIAAVASSIRHYLKGNEILLGTEASNEAANRLRSLASRGLLIRLPDDTYKVRHRLIGKTISDRLAQDGILIDFYTKLAFIASVSRMTEFDFDGRMKRLLKYTLNHSILMDISDLERTRGLYSSVESLQINNHHFWLQRGSLELEMGNIGHAQNYLAQARELDGDDPFVKLQCAHLDLKKANTNPKSEGAKELMEQGFDSLLELIRERGAKDAYPYHVIGNQGLSWSRRALNEPNEKKAFLERLLGIIDAGLKFHRREEYLEGIRENLQREILLMAVQ